MAILPGGLRRAWAALPLELTAGVIMFAHGLPKLAAPALFAERALGGIPLFLAYLVIAAELGGGLLLLAGALVRFAAFSHVCVMLVAVTQVHWATGLTGQGGFEFPLALLGAALALMVLGPDPLSIDQNVLPSMSRARQSRLRAGGTDVGKLRVKAAGALLILAGLALPIFRTTFAIPEGTLPLAISIACGVVSVAAGVAVIWAKSWSYPFAFTVARLYLAASVLLLFWIKYTLRGAAAVALSLVLLAALRSARREMH